MLTHKNAKAYAVLCIVMDRFEDHDEWDKMVKVEGYVNCREQGFCITFWYDKISSPRKVSFSENRNSDHIMVYYGESHQFSNQGNIPTDEMRKNAKSFEPFAYLSAAEMIIKFLKTGKVK